MTINFKSLFIFLAALTIYLLFSHIMPITDPVEGNYALTAKEMVLSSDWVSPQIYGKVWYDKPVLFYWFVASSFKVLGFSDMAARLVPAAFSALGVSLIYWFTSKISTERKGVIAAAILGTSFQYMVMGKLVITDTLLFLFGNAALVFFYLGYIAWNDTKRWYILLYPCMALAVLTKGPVGLVLPALIIGCFLTLQKKWSEIRYMYIPLGLVIFGVIAVPWYGLMYMKHGTEFLNTFLGIHNYLRATVSEHPKDNVFYYYPVVFALGMLPWSGLALRSLYSAFNTLRSKEDPQSQFWLVWIFAYLVFYTLMATKYLTYTFPVLFPTAILIAEHIDALLTKQDLKTMIVWIGVPLTLLMTGFIIIAYRYLEGIALFTIAGSLFFLLLVTWWKMRRGYMQESILAVFCCSVAAFILVSASVLPVVANLRSGKIIAESLKIYHAPKIGIYHDYSTSAVYYSGNVLVKIVDDNTLSKSAANDLNWDRKYTMPAETLAEFMGKDDTTSKLLVVPRKRKAEFEQAATGLAYKVLAENEVMLIVRIDHILDKNSR